MIDPLRRTLPQALPRQQLTQLVRAVPPGRFPTYPWATQLSSNPALSRGLWRGVGGFGALAGGEALARLIPGDGRMDDLARRAGRGAAVGSVAGWPGAAIGALVNSAFPIL